MMVYKRKKINEENGTEQQNNYVRRKYLQRDIEKDTHIPDREVDKRRLY